MTALQEGTLVGGRYRIVKRLGVGGMGAVYLANVEGMAGFEKLVALKIAHDHLSTEKTVMQMFLAEARLSAQLHHANLGQVYDLGQSDELYFIAMEYVPGVDLRRLIRTLELKAARLPVPIAIGVVSKLLEGLEYAHALRDKGGKPLKLVHRDVTPVNCLLSYTGDVKLIDFGIAKAANQAATTKTGMVRGKLNYMSPEQAKGQALDLRTDIFAIGVILYELLVGVRPFDAQSDMELMSNLISGRYPLPRDLDPQLPEPLERIVIRALERDRNRRFATAGQMQEALQDWALQNKALVGARALAEFVTRACAPEDAPATEATDETEGAGTPPEDASPQAMVTRSQLSAPTKLHPRAPPTVRDLPPVELSEPRSGADDSPSVVTPRAAELPSANSGTDSPSVVTPREAELPSATSGDAPPWVRTPREAEPHAAREADDSPSVRTPLVAEPPPARGAADFPPVKTLLVAEPAPARGADDVPSARDPQAAEPARALAGDKPVRTRRETEPLVHPLMARRQPDAAQLVWATVAAMLVSAGLALVVRGVLPSRTPSTGVGAPASLAPRVVAPPVPPPPATRLMPPPAEPLAERHPASTAVAETKPAPGPINPTHPPQTSVKKRPPTTAAAPAPTALPAYLDVRASGPAEVFIDGLDRGTAPLRSTLKPGRHEVRVDCIYPTGRNTGPVSVVQLPPLQDTEFERKCPTPLPGP